MSLPKAAPLSPGHPLRAPGTPPDVEVRLEPRVPAFDPTLGIAVPRRERAPAPAPATNRLVTLGDSLTHGFQSFAIWNTAHSYPVLVARALGCADTFRYPGYENGGLPLNIEALVRNLEHRFGDSVDWYELLPAAVHLQTYMDGIEDYWERGPGSQLPRPGPIPHNLGIYSWDVRDALSKDAGFCKSRIQNAAPRDNLLNQLVEHHNEIAALRVLPAGTAQQPPMSTVEAAEALSRESAGSEIETLIVALGANNALGTVVSLKVAWSEEPAYRDLNAKGAFTIWRPEHFRLELAELTGAIRRIRARHTIWATVPHVTIAPLARGVGGKSRPGSRYFQWYTYAWIPEDKFDPSVDPNLTADQARAIDAAIDQYNEAIEQGVAQARREGLDWYLFDLAGLLDRLAVRRYRDDPQVDRPGWWSEYPLPPPLNGLVPEPDSRFFSSGPQGRTQGGLFSLDGVHPTTIGYGIVAHEILEIMRLAGVAGVGDIDFAELLAQDTLMSNPPVSLSADLRLLGWIHHNVNLLSALCGGRK
jgi:hypothetical protein